MEFKVPIRNLFCILSYVHEIPELVKSLNEVDEDIITYDFIANEFLKEVDRISHRGLVKSYVTHVEPTGRLGGRLLLNESIPYFIARKPLVVCEKDEYSANVLENQLLKATLKAISYNKYVKEETRKRSFMMLDLFPEVDVLPLTKGIFNRVHFSKHNAYYKRSIHIAKILHELTLLSHKQGDWSLFKAELDEKALNHLFEKFLFHFYRMEQNEYKVSSERFSWNLQGNEALLPSMVTDVSLTHKNGREKIIIDAKFYKHIFQEHFGKQTFHSHNMYQLFTYLMHQPQELDVRGVLFYPFNGRDVQESFVWDERMKVEVLTLNLDLPWREINDQLLRVL
ncbi:5-methylcytosine restriction system specificity protein McrC [Sutcliffiella cohnii]|uniref:McrC family protein n=1 Tax=Sutcliffiella cohnii TaxID=33932 RepID=UPI002E2111D7|nr:hypothetical protein [Sutcliffiella cohnii]